MARLETDTNWAHAEGLEHRGALRRRDNEAPADGVLYVTEGLGTISTATRSVGVVPTAPASCLFLARHATRANQRGRERRGETLCRATVAEGPPTRAVHWPVDDVSSFK